MYRNDKQRLYDDKNRAQPHVADQQENNGETNNKIRGHAAHQTAEKDERKRLKRITKKRHAERGYDTVQIETVAQDPRRYDKQRHNKYDNGQRQRPVEERPRQQEYEEDSRTGEKKRIDQMYVKGKFVRVQVSPYRA
ncbi:hypothetical protein AGMMS49983_19550 [Clostridia bacterium]|nr:hypothetical protein AGMMS49983_19550 [Clostridia bacterium]